MFYHPSFPATMLSHWTPKQQSEGRRVGPWNPHCSGADGTWIGNLGASPHCHPNPEQNGCPTTGTLCQPWRQGWPQAAHCSHTQLVHSPVRVSSLCREGSLSCNPKEIQTHTCEIRRNHWLPQESIKLYFIVFLVFVKDTYSHSR